jgi:prepilin-type N-terminal cleavage/methylation domain-containing protein
MKFRSIRNSKSGFTLIELLVVVFITATLTGIVTFNFREQRIQQERMAAGQEMVSRIRGAQNNILAGTEVQGQSPDKYELLFEDDQTSYQIVTLRDEIPINTETVTLSQNITISALLVNSSGVPSAKISMSSPFGKILINDTENWRLTIYLAHTHGGDPVKVDVSGVSGRITILP